MFKNRSYVKKAHYVLFSFTQKFLYNKIAKINEFKYNIYGDKK